MNILARLAHKLRRTRLAMAEQDLAWMEAHAPEALRRQRAQVAALRARITPGADDIAHRSTQRHKRTLLHP